MIIDSYGNRRFFGVYRGVVQDNVDPLGKGRVKLKVPQVLADSVTDWAWGTYTSGIKDTSPDLGQGVFVQFEGGDPSFPIWTDSFSSDGTVDFLQLNTAYENGSEYPGMLAWDTYAQTPQVKVGNGEVTLQLGQEFHIIVANNTNATITNGSVVAFNGGLGVGGHPSVVPYIANGSKKSFLVAGIATQDIPSGTEGLITSKGIIHDLDTSAFNTGDVLFASPLFAGKLTSAQPTPPDEVVVVAVVTNSSSSTGEIYVTITPVIQQLTTTITLYQTNVSSDISGYFKMVNSQSDPSFPSSAVTIPVPSTSLGGSVGTSVLLSSFAAPANLFTGDPGAAVNITTAGNIMKTSGNNNTQTLFYFSIFKRSSSGTETLIGTSSQTGPTAAAPLNIWQQFTSVVTAALGAFTNTDRIVVKFYAYIAQAGSQSYALQFGDGQPFRTIIPVPVAVVATSPATGVSVDTTNFNGSLTSSENTVQKALDKLDDVNVGVTSLTITSPNLSGGTITSTGTVSLNPTLTGMTSITGTTTLTLASASNANVVLAPNGTGTVDFSSKNLTSTGNITGSGAVTITSGGTNTNITLAPNGTGTVDFSSKNITSVGTITATTFSGTATNATNFAVTNDVATASAVYPVWVTANSGNNAGKVSSTALRFVPSTGTLTTTTFSGALSGNATSSTLSTKSTNIVGGNNTTSLGALPYQADIDTTILLLPNTTSTKKFLRQTGTGTNGAIPAWDTVDGADITSGQVPSAYGGVPTGAIFQWVTASAPTGYLLCDGTAVSRTTYATLFGVISTTYGVGNGSTTFNVPNFAGRVPVGYQAPTSLGTATITIAAPGVVTRANHGLATGQIIYFTTTGALPTGLVANTRYFVYVLSTSTFRVSTTLANALAGTGITTSGTQSGTHTVFTADFDLGRSNGETNHIVTTLEMPSHTHGTGNIGSDENIWGSGAIANRSANVNSNSQTASGGAGGTLPHLNLQPYLVTYYIIKT